MNDDGWPKPGDVVYSVGEYDGPTDDLILPRDFAGVVFEDQAGNLRVCYLTDSHVDSKDPDYFLGPAFNTKHHFRTFREAVQVYAKEEREYLESRLRVLAHLESAANQEIEP